LGNITQNSEDSTSRQSHLLYNNISYCIKIRHSIVFYSKHLCRFLSKIFGIRSGLARIMRIPIQHAVHINIFQDVQWIGTPNAFTNLVRYI